LTSGAAAAAAAALRCSQQLQLQFKQLCSVLLSLQLRLQICYACVQPVDFFCLQKRVKKRQ
jgi:hypothetical protein